MWQKNKYTFPLITQSMRPTGTLETIITSIILECRTKSTLSKPTLEPQCKPAVSTNNITFFPQYTLRNISVQTSWPCNRRFRAPTMAYSLLFGMWFIKWMDLLSHTVGYWQLKPSWSINHGAFAIIHPFHTFVIVHYILCLVYTL